MSRPHFFLETRLAKAIFIAFVCLFVSFFVFLLVCLFVCLFVCLSVCLFVHSCGRLFISSSFSFSFSFYGVSRDIKQSNRGFKVKSGGQGTTLEVFSGFDTLYSYGCGFYILLCKEDSPDKLGN